MRKHTKYFLFLMASACLCNNMQAMEKPKVTQLKELVKYKDTFGYNSEKTEAWIVRTFDDENGDGKSKSITVTKHLKSGKVECTCTEYSWDTGHRKGHLMEEPIYPLLYKLENFLKKQNVSGEKHSDKNELMVKSKVLEKIKDPAPTNMSEEDRIQFAKELQKQLKTETNKFGNISAKTGTARIISPFKSFLDEINNEEDTYGGQLQITGFGSKSDNPEYCYTGKTIYDDLIIPPKLINSHEDNIKSINEFSENKPTTQNVLINFETGKVTIIKKEENNG
jgi:hypothetical protein